MLRNANNGFNHKKYQGVIKMKYPELVTKLTTYGGGGGGGVLPIPMKRT